MADKIKRWDPEDGCYNCEGGDMYDYKSGSYVLYTDHQAAMREACHAAMELATAIRSGITNADESYTYFTKRGVGYVETKIAELLTALSARQECGGGGSGG